MDKKQEKIALNAKFMVPGMDTEIYEMLDKESMEHNRRALINRIGGTRSQFTYTCPNCKNTFTTKKSYQIDYNPIQKFFWEFGLIPMDLLLSLIDNTIGDIPWIGYTASDQQERRMVNKRSKIYSRFLDGMKIKAYKEEMMSTFILQKNGQNYGCEDCIK